MWSTRFFVIWCWMVVGMYAGSYPSFHQMTEVKGLVNELKALERSSNGLLEMGTYINIRGEARGESAQWCGDRFGRIKIFIPPGLGRADVSIVFRPNSSHYVLWRFVPIGSKEEIDWTSVGEKRKFYTTHQVPIINVATVFIWNDRRLKYYKDINEFKGGWLYLQIIQASKFLDSHFGHVSSPSAQVIVSYYYDENKKEIIDNWLKNTFFSSNGDPIDGFETITEKMRYCSNYGKKETIHGVIKSDITGYELFYGISPDPNEPKLTVQADKTSLNISKTVTLTSILTTQEASLDGINVEINQNTTTGVLLENHIQSSCATFAQANGTDDHARGQLIYSDNGVNWYDNPNDEAIADNVRYIGYLLSGSYPKASKAKLSVKFNISRECRESLKDTATLRYMLNGEEKNIQKILTLPYGTASSSSSYQSASTISGGYNGGGGSGTISSGTDDSWSGYGSTTDESNHEQELCQERGGRWVDNVCLDAKVESSASISSSSAQSSWSSVATQSSDESNHEQELCQERGGRWVDNVCLDAKVESSASISSSSAQSSVFSAKGERSFVDAEEIVVALAQKEYPINGYFVHYGSGPFDWFYYSLKTGSIYKLDGMKSNGYFKWTPLTQYFSGTEIRGGKLILGEVKFTRDLDTRTSNIIRAIQKQKEYPINGYFVHYGSGPFDWFYYSLKTGSIYKLDGMKSNGYFKWTPLTQYFSGIQVKNGTIIKIGEAYIGQELQKKKEACENILHGQWVQDNSRWMCIVEEGSVDRSSSSSSRFASSSSMSLTSNSIGAFPNISE